MSIKLFHYFPFLDKQKIDPNQLRNLILQEINSLKNDSDFKNLEIFETLDHMNYRAPLSIPYHIKDELKNKIIFHIGSRRGEFDILFCKYSKKNNIL